VPLVYELEDDLSPIRRFYLGDSKAIAEATASVADQLKKR
jgi:2,3-bisphosphoglycerate-dependent phosphoglycerate mutase